MARLRLRGIGQVGKKLLLSASSRVCRLHGSSPESQKACYKRISQSITDHRSKKSRNKGGTVDRQTDRRQDANRLKTKVAHDRRDLDENGEVDARMQIVARDPGRATCSMPSLKAATASAAACTRIGPQLTCAPQ